MTYSSISLRYKLYQRSTVIAIMYHLIVQDCPGRCISANKRSAEDSFKFISFENMFFLKMNVNEEAISRHFETFLSGRIFVEVPWDEQTSIRLLDVAFQIG